MKSLKPVLYAEDDENDVFLMERAFDLLGISNPLRVAPDGKHAIAYLAGREPFTDREQSPLPCLMLLDLSLPGRHGLDVLQWIKNQPSLSSLPVVVLSSSSQESDIHRAYLLQADGYLVKPGDPDALIQMVRRLSEYWLAETRPAGPFVDFSGAGNVRPIGET
jgi:CheY-like chemotaxis protein